MIKFCILPILAYLVRTTITLAIIPEVLGCNIVITELDPQPVVVSTTTYEFLYPEPGENAVPITVGTDIIISCPNGQVTEGSNEIGETVTARCISNTTFEINNKFTDFKQIKCSKRPSDSARYTGNSCEGGSKEIEIGFSLTSSSFARQYLVCFDDSNKAALYSAFTLTKSIGQQQTGVSRPSFDEENFYNLGTKVNDLYTRSQQRSSINALLGLPENSTKYIQDSSNYYLARGHLAAKADFFYETQHHATFYFCNAAPQWQTFNGDNWAIVERNVRDYAEDNGLDLAVYTGTYGVTSLPHEETGEDIPLYLYVDSNGNTAIPVPELCWKVVYDPKSKRGVALLGLNNPYQENLNKSKICEDVQDAIQWLSWKPTNQKSGYAYACSVDDFRQTVSYLPQFEVTDLLT